jgi:DNA-binding response OmpR family regulator
VRKGTVLIIEDDPDIVELVRYNLEQENYSVVVAETGEKGLDLAWSDPPQLVLLDLGLPGIQGLEVCRVLKGSPRTQEVPVVMLTAKGEEDDVVAGLEIGADDYVRKPFRVRELVARVRAILRRTPQAKAPQEQIMAGPLVIDLPRHEVYKNKQLITLTRAEFRLLRTLVMNAGRVLTREQLLNEITEGTTYIIDRNVDVHVRAVRKKLGDARDLIATVRGVGYKFRDRTAAPAS